MLIILNKDMKTKQATMNGLMKRQHFLRFSQFELLGFNSDSIKMAIAENTKNKLIFFNFVIYHNYCGCFDKAKQWSPSKW